MRPVCEFYVRSKCNRGEKGIFRHSGPGVPTGTFFASQPLDEAQIKASELERIHGPGTMTMVVNAMKVTFATDVVPVDVEFTGFKARNVTPPQNPSMQTHRIRLPHTQEYRNDVEHGGLERAKHSIGSDLVTFDGDSDPPAIVVRGDVNVLRQVQRCLYPDKPRKTVECSICWEQCEDFVKVPRCGHVACKECFASHCTVNSKSNLPLRCFQTECETLLQLQQIRSTVDKCRFHQLLSTAVKDHLVRHPKEFAQCSGSKCTTYYRISDAHEQHTCPKCGTVSCPTCKVKYHEGQSCEAYQDSIDDRALYRWIREQGGKQCPKCNAVIQKLVGCDNMDCPICKANFCWQCLKVFPSHSAVYTHLREAHGGYWGDPRHHAQAMLEVMDDDDFRDNPMAVRALLEAPAVNDGNVFRFMHQAMW